MPDIDAVLRRPARYFYEEIASAEEQEEIDRLIGYICSDPHVDDEVKFLLPAPPVILTVYDSGDFWIVYHLLNNFTIAILNIGYAREPRTPNRPEAH